MKKYSIFMLLFIVTYPVISQESEHNLIIGLGFGGGVTRWQLQKMIDGSTYDNLGSSVPIQLEAYYQYRWLRLGAGVSYEQIFIDALTSSVPNSAEFTFANQQAGLSKIYLQLELAPVKFANINIGVMGNYGIYHLDDQFTNRDKPVGVFFTGGVLGEYSITNTIRFYLNPIFQMKFFEFYRDGIPLDIQNTLGTGALIVGFRYIVF